MFEYIELRGAHVKNANRICQPSGVIPLLTLSVVLFESFHIF